MVDHGVIESREFVKDDHYKTVIALKSVAGSMFLDARKWAKFNNQSEYYPRKAGLMLSVEDWRTVIPMIQELINTVDAK